MFNIGCGLFVFSLCLAPFYGTWLAAVMIGGVILVDGARWLIPLRVVGLRESRVVRRLCHLLHATFIRVTA